jgi:hypothetical protein
LIQSVLPQLNFSFYRHQPIRADFSGGQITSDAGLLPLRAFDQRHHLTCDWAADLSDPRQHDRLRHDSLALLRQRIYQIVAGYEDANDADRLRHDPMLQIVADHKLGDALGSQPTSVAGRTRLPLATWYVATTSCASSSSASAATRSASVARFCSTSTPPTIPLMASNNSASSTAVMASTCITPC